MLSIPSTKGFEVGSGFSGTEVPGSRHNDMFVEGEGGKLGCAALYLRLSPIQELVHSHHSFLSCSTSTNWSGGIQGGITNGEDIYFR